MRVLVTGGTGFVGSHTVAAMLRAGHDVRLLVRSPDRVGAAFAPHGVMPGDVVVGDVTDRPSVVAALADCEAVLHAANVFTFAAGAVETMQRVNTEGTEIVLGEAADRGLDPIVHVSSFVALLPADGTVTAETSVGDPPGAYSGSKADAERIARALQDRGAPVVITYPGAVWGPDDPYLGESAGLAIGALSGKMRVLNDGLLAISDVRDVADVHTAVLQSGLGPRRYLTVGHDIPLRNVVRRLGDLTGRNLWSIRVPSAVALGTARAADLARRFGVSPPISFEPTWLIANGRPTDSSATRTDLGIEFRDADQTLADTVMWLLRAGHITAEQAGTLAGAA